MGAYPNQNGSFVKLSSDDVDEPVFFWVGGHIFFNQKEERIGPSAALCQGSVGPNNIHTIWAGTGTIQTLDESSPEFTTLTVKVGAVGASCAVFKPLW